MKNIFLLPTDKPTRLHIAKNNNIYCSQENVKHFVSDNDRGYNMYITSDEETKDGDWVLNSGDYDKDIVFKADEDFFHIGIEAKKIILTTDPDLIKNGVQAINDEFLEWFVKNPSCEYVEVQDWYNKFLSCCSSKEECYCNKKRIIIPKEEQCICKVGHPYNNACCKVHGNIPKEESKQDLEKEMFELEQELDIPSHLRWHNSKPKQETLEEATERKYPLTNILHLQLNTAIRTGFQEGAKWQQEKMYDIMNKYTDDVMGGCNLKAEEWFEQFKKK